MTKAYLALTYLLLQRVYISRKNTIEPFLDLVAWVKPDVIYIQAFSVKTIRIFQSTQTADVVRTIEFRIHFETSKTRSEESFYRVTSGLIFAKFTINNVCKQT